MTFNNPVIGYWLNVVFHLYMISNNPVIGSWLYIVFHSYMTSNNPFKKALGWIVVLSFIIRLLDVTKYNPLKKQKKTEINR